MRTTRHTRRWRGLGLVVVLAVLGAALAAAPARAGLPVDVKITLERIRALDVHDEPFGEADWYGVITIDGVEQENKNTPDQDANEDDDDISPGWEFSRTIDSDRGSIPVNLAIFDEDGFLRFDDDQTDINPGAGLEVAFTLQLAPCSISGISGACGASIVTAGDRDDDHAELTFRVDVEEPASAPGLNVRCTHEPAWPQATDTVTITAEVLDGALGSMIGDTVEIWVNSTAAPAQTQTGVTSSTFAAGPFAGPSFTYGCRVVDGGTPIFTGWRAVSVGGSPGEAVPVMLTGPRSSSIDIVFVGDEDDYSGPSDPLLLADVHDAINDGYWAEGGFGGTAFITQQNAINFWIAGTLGDAEDFASGCDHEAPEIAWQDVGAILHRDTFRDCAPGGQTLFSSEPFNPQTVVHETGHRPFGLADEYCCDGGYYQADPFPNLHGSLASCTTDAATFAPPGTCMQPTDGTTTIGWWRTEPTGDDLMEGSGNRTPQAADLRRIGFVFGTCRSAGC